MLFITSGKPQFEETIGFYLSSRHPHQFEMNTLCTCNLTQDLQWTYTVIAQLNLLVFSILLDVIFIWGQISSYVSIILFLGAMTANILMLFVNIASIYFFSFFEYKHNQKYNLCKRWQYHKVLSRLFLIWICKCMKPGCV